MFASTTSAGLAALAVLASSCAFTYTEHTKKVPIVTEPPGALVWKWDQSDKTQLGFSPVEYQLAYRRQTTRFNSWWWALPLASAAVSGGGIALWAGNGNETAGSYLAGIGLLGLTVGLLVCLTGELTDGMTLPIPQSVRFSATLAGHDESTSFLKLDDHTEQSVFLSLKPAARRIAGGENMSTPEPGPGSFEVLAVFDLEDRTGQFEQEILAQLTEYLSNRISHYKKFRVVPRSEIQRVLRRAKQESYRHCYDTGCQIELGRAVSAQKSLATVIMKPGRECIVAATLYDLRSEVSDDGVRVQASCSADGITIALDRIARDLGVRP